MARKSNRKAKAKAQAAERRRHKSDDSIEDEEPISSRTRAARSRRPNIENQASSDENSSFDDSANSEISELESRETLALQDSQANPSTSDPFDTEMQDAPDIEQRQESKRKEKRTRKQDKRVEEESDSSDEEIASNSNGKGKHRKGKPRKTSRGDDEAGEGASGDTQSNWGSECQEARKLHPMRKKASDDPGYDKIILKFDPDQPEKGPLEGKIIYVLDYRGCLFVTGPSLKSDNSKLERAWLLRGSDYPKEKERFLDIKDVTHVAKAKDLGNIPANKFRWNNIALTVNGTTGVFESWGNNPGQGQMRIWTLASVRSGYGAIQINGWAHTRRR